MSARPPRRWSPAALACSLLLVAGCTSTEPPAGRAAPWSERPAVELRFEVADDLSSVAGSERITFTPDLPTCEVVLRAWPNKPGTARLGNSLVVSDVRVDGRPAEPTDVAAGAPDTAEAGTLLEVPLVECAEAGDEVTVDVDFDLELGEGSDERLGMSASAEVAWFATAFPLLAWVRGQGWERGPAVPLFGETAVSEDFALDLEVVAPAAYEVLGTGRAAGTDDVPDGTTVHRFTADAVRDVAVSVGDLDVVEREIDGVRVHLALDQGVEAADAEEWLAQIAESTGDLVALLGAFPYDDLWVSVLSSQTSGIEFPGAVQFGDVDPAARGGLVTHELAHMWFYGLVGNDQGRHPWLDESFATFAQLVADGDEPPYAPLHGADLPPVGASMTYWSGLRRAGDTYFQTVYTRGGAALMEAREQAGHEPFDAALTRYVRENAYSVATPSDVREAFAELPEVLGVLEDVGALP